MEQRTQDQVIKEDLGSIIVETVVNLERTNGKPPYALEIFQKMERDQIPFDKTQAGFPMVLNQVLRSGRIFVNKEWNKYSETHSDEFQSFAERLEQTYPGYELDAEDNTLKPKDQRAINIQEIKKILLSDANNYDQEKYGWIFEGAPKFLDSSKQDGERVSLVTFPRTGNTFIRKVLQDLTGIATGSDFAIHGNISLQMTQMNGEGIADERVWFVKSHHPIPSNKAGEIKVNKLIITARNPLSVIYSGRNLLLSMTQDKEIAEDLNDEKFIDATNHSVQFTCEKMREYFRFYLDIAKSKKIPVHFVRYEDLVDDKYNVLINLFKFILGVDSLEGTVIEDKIKEYVKLGDEAGVVYKVKKIDFNKCFTKFNDDQKKLHCKILEDFLVEFGYIKHDGIENKYGFYNLEDLEESKLQNFEIFKKINEDHLKWVVDNKEEIKDLQFTINDQSVQYERIPLPILELQSFVSIKE